MFKDYTLQTTWRRALVALLVGAIITTLGFVIVDLYNFWSIFGGISLSPQNIFRVFLVLFSKFGIVVFAVFFPIGLIMYKFGFRTWISSALAGYLVLVTNDLVRLFAVPLYSTAVLGTAWWTNYYWAEFLFKSLLADLVVVPIALTIWRIAYRRPTPC